VVVARKGLLGARLPNDRRRQGRRAQRRQETMRPVITRRVRSGQSSRWRSGPMRPLATYSFMCWPPVRAYLVRDSPKDRPRPDHRASRRQYASDEVATRHNSARPIRAMVSLAEYPNETIGDIFLAVAAARKGQPGARFAERQASTRPSCTPAAIRQRRGGDPS
jgi:hypothetical protein